LRAAASASTKLLRQSCRRFSSFAVAASRHAVVQRGIIDAGCSMTLHEASRKPSGRRSLFTSLRA